MSTLAILHIRCRVVNIENAEGDNAAKLRDL